MRNRRTVFLACPYRQVGGRMGSIMAYLASIQQDPSGGFDLKRLESRRGGHIALSRFFLALAVGRILLEALRGRLAVVHLNLAERGSVYRKGVLLAATKLVGGRVPLHLHAAQIVQFHGSTGILLLELGDLRPSNAARALNAGEVADETLHSPPDKYRQRCFGDPTAIWGGSCVPFDPNDFETRPWIEHSGSPIGYDDMERQEFETVSRSFDRLNGDLTLAPAERTIDPVVRRAGAYDDHHIGTVRMAAGATSGVIEGNRKVFGMTSLYVAGRVVFPVASQANLTLTNVPLALRLVGQLMSVTSPGPSVRATNQSMMVH